MSYEINDMIEGFLDAINFVGGAALALQAESSLNVAVASIIAAGGFYRAIKRNDKKEVLEE